MKSNLKARRNLMTVGLKSAWMIMIIIVYTATYAVAAIFNPNLSERGDGQVGATNMTNPIFVNFGVNNTEAGWNNLTHIMHPAPHPRGTISNLIDKEGNKTGISLVYVTAFNKVRYINGATGTNIKGFEMPDAVSGQGFYSYGQEAVLRLEGLTNGQKYDLAFFASIEAKGNRETKYTVKGSNEVVALLNPSNNSSETVSANGVQPDANGHITITIAKGENNNNPNDFYCINALKLSQSK